MVSGGVSKPGAIHLRIVEVLKTFPEGASGGQIRQELEKRGLRPEDREAGDRRNVFDDSRSSYDADDLVTTVVHPKMPTSTLGYTSV
jgi:hypothetical protein